MKKPTNPPLSGRENRLEWPTTGRPDVAIDPWWSDWATLPAHQRRARAGLMAKMLATVLTECQNDPTKTLPTMCAQVRQHLRVALRRQQRRRAAHVAQP